MGIFEWDFNLEIKAYGPFRVGGIVLPYGERKKGQIKLLRYQENLLTCEQKCTLLDAPTGSGKTLASALVAIKRKGISVFIYPTNSLVMDQAESMSRDLSLCGVKAKVLDPKNPTAQDCDVLIFPVTSRSLDVLASSFGIKSHGEALIRVRTKILPYESSFFMLTNPDLLFSMLKGVPRFRRQEAIWRDLVQGITTLIVDEFHLFYGFSLANLLSSIFLLKDSLSRILFTSATHAATENLALMGCNTIKAKSVNSESEKSGRKIRYETLLFLSSLSAGTLWSDDHAKLLVKPVESFLNWARENASDSEVKVLVLVNSVVFAEKLYLTLKEKLSAEVNRIHGFVPEEMRETRSEVLIGTRAVDIGIDFDAASVIFEAMNAPDFIQRLGRGSRKRPGVALALVPGAFLGLLSKEFEQVAMRNMKFNEHHVKGGRDHAYMPYELMSSIVSNNMPGIKLYWNEISGLVGCLSLFTIIHSVNSSIRAGRGNVDEELGRRRVIEESLEVFRDVMKNPPPWLANVRENASELVKKALGLFIFRKKLISLAKCGLRGVPLPIRARFAEFGGVWGEIDVTELQRADFSVEKDEEGIYVEIRRPSVSKPLIVCLRRKTIGVDVLTDFDLDYDYKLKEDLQRLLKGVLCRFVFGKPNDWRFPCFQAVDVDGRKGYVIIGPDAFIGLRRYKHNRWR